jgi:hypothetical protein
VHFLSCLYAASPDQSCDVCAVVKLPISVGADQKATVLERQSLASGVGSLKQLHQLGDTPLARPGTRMLAALGVSFVLGILGARFLFDSTPGGTATEARETSTVPLPSSNVAAMRDAAATLPKPAQGADTLDRPLPPLDAPFTEVVDVLRERARNGDAESACRLAAEYALCASVPRQLSDFERWLAQRQLAIRLISDPILLKEAKDNVRRELGPRERSVSKIRRHCAGVDQASPTDIANDWLSAAKAGSLAAMKNFASGNAFRWDSILDVLPELSEYRSLAEPMAIEVAKKRRSGNDAGACCCLFSTEDWLEKSACPDNQSESGKIDCLVSIHSCYKRQRRTADAHRHKGIRFGFDCRA